MKLRNRVRRRIVSGIMAFLCSVVLIIAGKTSIASAEAQPLVGASGLQAIGVSVSEQSQPGAPVLQAAGVTISGQPQNVTVAVGDTATFTVTASGTSLTYQWQCKAPGSSSWSNSTQTGAKTKTLSVVTNVNHNGYQYRCVIKSGNTQTISNAATLMVIPKFIMQPANQRVTVGSTATFTVSAAGKGTLTYQWQCKSPTASTWSNSTQTGAKTASLSVVTNVNHEGYKYRCVVTDANGKKAYSNAASLAVAPSFTTQPKSTSVTVGDTATFTVAAKGKATLTYQWQCKEPGATSWRDSALGTAKSAKLSIKTDTGYNGYQYRCIVTDGNNRKTTSNAVTLTITPKITTQPSNKTVSVGTTAIFSITAKGKSTLKYQWQAKGPKASTWSNSTQSGATTNKLSVSTTINHNGYQYRCVVTDGNGEQITSEEVTLSVVPKITMQPTSKNVSLGTTATFSVTASGKGIIKYQWQYQSLSSLEWVNSQQNGAETPTLSIKTTLNHQAYRYRCIVTDGNGQTISNEAVLTLYDIPVTAQTFPDERFRKYISDTFDADKNDKLSITEIQEAKEIDVDYEGIKTLKGIEFFPSLEELSCNGNVLSSLNLRGCTSLVSLNCENCHLTKLDVCKNTLLERLDCGYNQLVQLDVSKNSSLVNLYCYDNQLVQLDVSKNDSLINLYCNNNQLIQLDLGRIQRLELLKCSNNRLTTLDASKNTSIAKIYCNNNQLKTLNLSNNTALKYLDCSSNKLTVCNLFGCSSVQEIDCSDNLLQSLNLDGMTALYSLNCAQNQLTSLDVTDCLGLLSLYCYNNQIRTLSLGNIPNLKTLNCEYNQLQLLDLTICSGLLTLGCGGNPLKSLDVSNCTKMTSLYCFQNGLKSLFLKNNTELEELACWDNELTSLDVSKNKKLLIVSAKGNSFDTINLKNNTEIQYWETDAMGLIKHPVSYQAPAGGFAVFSVTVCGENLSYQWQVKTQASDGWVNLTDASAKDNVLRISVKAAQNGNQYRCVITNANGKKVISNPATLTVANIVINESSFPDAAFRAFVLEKVDTNQNGELSASEALAVTELHIVGRGIQSLKGIEFFTNLESLDCSTVYGTYESEGGAWGGYSTNEIAEIDVSRNILLTELVCSQVYLERLDVRNNRNLVTLKCDHNGYSWCGNLQFLDVRNNTSLTRLDCGSNSLRYLDVSQNVALKELLIYGTSPLSGTVDISNNVNLERLDFSESGIYQIDVSKNHKLKSIVGFMSRLSTLDVSNNPELEYIHIGSSVRIIGLRDETEVNVW